MLTVRLWQQCSLRPTNVGYATSASHACRRMACMHEHQTLCTQDLPGLQDVKACLEEKHTAHFLECALTINSYLPARQVEDTFAVLKCAWCTLNRKLSMLHHAATPVRTLYARSGTADAA